MSRQLRVEHAGAVYHITDRGNERRNILGSDGDRLEALTGQIILGSQGIVRTIARQVNEQSRKKEIPRGQRYSAGIELDEIFQEGTRQGQKRDAPIHRAYVEGGYPMRQIGEHSSRHYSSISLAIRRYEKVNGQPAIQDLTLIHCVPIFTGNIDN